MKNLKWNSSLLITGLIILSGCNSYSPKSLDPMSDPNAAGNLNPDFATVQSKIFQPYCVMCHSSGVGNSGGVNLETYANVKRFIDQIQSSVVTRQTMPPGQPLSKDLQQLLINWVANGSPEVAQNLNSGPTSATTPTPSPVSNGNLQATFASISQNILKPKCVICHDADSGTLIMDYKTLLRRAWVVPNDLTKSALYKAVKGRSMPPDGPLSKTEIQAIGTWITNGAPEN